MLRVLLLIVDERRMMSSELLDEVQRHASLTVLGGHCEKVCFGGIPVILLLGDDNQLPPVSSRNGQGKGAFHVFVSRITKCYNSDLTKAQERGFHLFKKLAENSIQLTVRKRQANDVFTMKIIEDLETGEPSVDTISTLISKILKVIC